MSKYSKLESSIDTRTGMPAFHLLGIHGDREEYSKLCSIFQALIDIFPNQLQVQTQAPFPDPTSFRKALSSDHNFPDLDEQQSSEVVVFYHSSALLDPPTKILTEFHAILSLLKRTLNLDSSTSGQKNTTQHPTIRLFISGDRSQVGKSTMCLGLLQSFLTLGYVPEELAYVKPVTQCTKVQPVSRYCREWGIPTVDPIVVFLPGFTRTFVSGKSQKTSQAYLDEISSTVVQAVVGRKTKILVIDGVGYPAVGSICGLSNADVAKALRASVVLVGKPGVGDAVDTYNLNARYFTTQGLVVLGAIFNRLEMTGNYALDKCQTFVTQYFDKQRTQGKARPFGFVPKFDRVPPTNTEEKYEWLLQWLEGHFLTHVDVSRLIHEALEQQQESESTNRT